MTLKILLYVNPIYIPAYIYIIFVASVLLTTVYVMSSSWACFDLHPVLTYCLQDIAIHNLDYILTVSSHAFASASPEILANVENLLDRRSSEPWSYRRLPTPTATFPVIITSEEEDSESEVIRTRDYHNNKSTSKTGVGQRSDSFLQPKDDPNQGTSKQVRALRKKLQQIEMLEAKQSKGHILDNQQIAKLQTKSTLESSLAELGVPMDTAQEKTSASASPDMKGNKKAEVSRKQRRKSKQKSAQVETVSSFHGTGVESNPVKDILDVEVSEVSMNKVRLLSFLYKPFSYSKILNALLLMHILLKYRI